MKLRVLILSLWFLFAAIRLFAQTVEEGLFVEIGGIRQWVNISGDNANAPVLLFLHGGPGNPPAGESLATLALLRKKFLLVIWHQRESSRTLAENKSPVPLSSELLYTDTEEIAEWLKKKYPKNALMVMGHSWGGYLAVRLAGSRPDLVSACILVSPMIHQEESERLALDSLKRWADWFRPEARRELDEIRLPLQDGRSLFLQRKWMAIHSDAAPAGEKFVREWSDRWLQVFQQASAADFNKQFPVIRCPVAFLIGRRDLQTHFRVAESYYQQLQAPDKKWFWFNRSGHAPHRSEPEYFLRVVNSLSKGI